MKKPLLALISLGLLGLVCGILSAGWHTAFLPVCGEECNAARWGAAMAVALVEAAWFVLAGCLLKSWKSCRLFVASLVLLPLTALLLSHGWYRHQAASQAVSSDGLVVDQDYSHVVVATESVPQLGITRDDRCSLGTAHCDDTPRFIEAHCKGVVVNITENYWRFFQRLPEEDFAGMPSKDYQDFPNRVCATSMQGTSDD
jgi:hypothetical protein